MAINTFFTYIWLVIAVADGKSFGVADPLSGFSYRRKADDYLFVIFDLARLAVQSAGTQVRQRDAVAAVMLFIYRDNFGAYFRFGLLGGIRLHYRRNRQVNSHFLEDRDYES